MPRYIPLDQVFSTANEQERHARGALELAVKKGDSASLRAYAAAGRLGETHEMIVATMESLAGDAERIGHSVDVLFQEKSRRRELAASVLLNGARVGNEHAVRQALRHGPPADAKYSALLSAAEAGRVGATALLLRSGLNPHVLLAELSKDDSVPGVALSARVAATLRDAGGLR